MNYNSKCSSTPWLRQNLESRHMGSQIAVCRSLLQSLIIPFGNDIADCVAAANGAVCGGSAACPWYMTQVGSPIAAIEAGSAHHLA